MTITVICMCIENLQLKMFQRSNSNFQKIFMKKLNFYTTGVFFSIKTHFCFSKISCFQSHFFYKVISISQIKLHTYLICITLKGRIRVGFKVEFKADLTNFKENNCLNFTCILKP